jgi:hypothetical protein
MEVVQIGFLVNIRNTPKHTSCINLKLAKPPSKKHRNGVASNNCIKGSPRKDCGLGRRDAPPFMARRYEA